MKNFMNDFLETECSMQEYFFYHQGLEVLYKTSGPYTTLQELSFLLFSFKYSQSNLS